MIDSAIKWPSYYLGWHDWWVNEQTTLRVSIVYLFTLYQTDTWVLAANKNYFGFRCWFVTCNSVKLRNTSQQFPGGNCWEFVSCSNSFACSKFLISCLKNPCKSSRAGKKSVLLKVNRKSPYHWSTMDADLERESRVTIFAVARRITPVVQNNTLVLVSCSA